MIQEKDFLYRVPVKTAPITTPRGQIRNPEILVDLEGGEFMHGNILDANSTNKLVNQSVKEAIDNKIIEGGYVTKDLLEAETTRATEQENSLKTLIDAETSARTKGDEDLNSKIKAEQTRAEGKEKEISDKLAIVNGDSNTEGSFRKAIADVVAAAPEDLDTLKEIADKLVGNDDLHTALNQAITEKADMSALVNEVSRATGVENDLETAIGTKADATALSNYVLTTALNQQIDTLNTAISAKQDAGNYITFKQYIESANSYEMDKYFIYNYITPGHTHIITSIGEGLKIAEGDNGVFTYMDAHSISIAYPMKKGNSIEITPQSVVGRIDGVQSFILDENGVSLMSGDNNHVLTSFGSTIDITQYALKTELPTIPTNVSQLTNDSNFITQQDADAKYALANSLNTVNDSVSSLRVGLSKKQNKITVNSVDITDIETADITKLRTIVRDLIDALSTSGLIVKTSNLE